MSVKKAFLVLNGEPPKNLPNLKEYTIICAADGAYKVLKEQGITPHFISGDFDSLEEFPEDVDIINTPNQNFTDFDKVLQILLNKGIVDVDVYGASGKEQDHFLGNLHTAIQWKDKLKLTFFDNYGYYFLADKNLELKNCSGKIISLIPFPEAKEITTNGLVYPLKNEKLTFGERIGTRNEANSNNVSITYKSGNLFVFVNEKQL